MWSNLYARKTCISKIIIILLIFKWDNNVAFATVTKDSATHSVEQDGAINVAITKFVYMPNSSVVNTNTINGVTTRENYFGGFENGGTPYFGVEFNPLIKGGPAQPNLKYLLKVVGTRSASILTNDMGYSDTSYSGAWDTSTNSRIATSCAEMNKDSRSQVCSVLQGAIISHEGGGAKPLDLDAAFLSARHANGIYPNTVWGIKIGVGWERGRGFVKDVRTGYRAVAELRDYKAKAHGLNLRIGVFVGICGEIMGGDGKKMLGDLAAVSDFFICGIYPLADIQDPQDAMNYVTQKFEVYKPRYASVAPKLDLILQTGWTRSQQVDQRETLFWNGMEKWAFNKGVKVYMHEAFDSTIPRGGIGNSGHWRLDRKSGGFVEKGTGQIVSI